MRDPARRGDPACPGGLDWKSNFYPCIEHHAWAHRPVLVLDSLPGIVSPLGIGLAACVALASLAVFAPGIRRRRRRSATATPADAR